jgi:hypothetical protein
LKEFSDELTLVLLYSITATIISTIIALLSVRNSSVWKIGLNLSLISIVSSVRYTSKFKPLLHFDDQNSSYLLLMSHFNFQGIFGKLIGNTITVWSVHLKGAVYVTSFRPLQIVISVAMSVMFLGDTLHLGRYG